MQDSSYLFHAHTFRMRHSMGNPVKHVLSFCIYDHFSLSLSLSLSLFSLKKTLLVTRPTHTRPHGSGLKPGFLIKTIHYVNQIQL